MFSPEGATGGNGESVIDTTFGPLSGIRPDLAAGEVAEAERKEAGKPAKRAFDIERPILDSERIEEEPDPDKEVPPKAARDNAPPAEGSTDTGGDPESAGDDDAALEALVDKYQGKPKSMAKAMRELRRLQTATAEERKDLETQLEAALGVIDSDYEWVNGKPVLKSDVAARSLRNGAGKPPSQFVPPTEEQVRAQVTSEFKQAAADSFDDDQIPVYLQRMKPMIDKITGERLEVAKAQVAAQRYGMLAAVGDVVERHLRAHPEDKDIMGDIDAIYANVPEEVRHAAILDEWMPFGRIAELVRTEKSVRKIAKEAYDLGRKHRAEGGKPADAGAPGKSGSSPRKPSGQSAETVVSGLSKEGILRGSGLPSIDQLFAR